MHYCTIQGADRMARKWSELEQMLRSIQGKKADVVAAGGIFDNFSYDEIMREEDLINGQMRDLRKTMNNMVVINDAICADTSKLRIGHVAKITVDGKEQEYRIGGYGDHDPLSVPIVISYLAPLVKNLIGQEKGFSCTIPLNCGPREIVLVDINLQ